MVCRTLTFLLLSLMAVASGFSGDKAWAADKNSYLTTRRAFIQQLGGIGIGAATMRSSRGAQANTNLTHTWLPVSSRSMRQLMFPDLNVSYHRVVFAYPSDQPCLLRIEGQFSKRRRGTEQPIGRYLGFSIYRSEHVLQRGAGQSTLRRARISADDCGTSHAALHDSYIEPDEGSINPFRQGVALRHNESTNYTVWVAPESLKQRLVNQRNVIVIPEELTKHVLELWYRVYDPPSEFRDVENGAVTQVPQLYAVAAENVPAADQDLPHFFRLSSQLVPTLHHNKPVYPQWVYWRALDAGRKAPPARFTRPNETVSFFRPPLGQFQNGKDASRCGTDYLYTDVSPDLVTLFELTPPNHAGRFPLTGNEDVRYWSMSTGNHLTFSFASLLDRHAVKGSDGKVRIVVAGPEVSCQLAQILGLDEKLQPNSDKEVAEIPPELAQALAQRLQTLKLNYLPFLVPTLRGLVIYRNAMARKDFSGNIAHVPPVKAATKLNMGKHAPMGQTYTVNNFITEIADPLLRQNLAAQ